MKTSIFSLLTVLSFAMIGGCLYSGDGTQGLPCNTDTECGGTQVCIEHICGGPAAAETGVTTGIGSADATDHGSDGSSGDAPVGDEDSDVRTECEPSETQCLEGEVLRVCTEDGKLSTRDCEGWCGRGTAYNGCHETPAGEELCWCLNQPAECTDEGSVHCEGTNIIECSDGLEIAHDCDSVCIDAGYSGADSCALSDGQPTCFCLDGGCTDGARRCVDDDTAQECAGGSWQTYDCADANCPAGTYSRGCTYIPGDTESCGCWDL